MVSCIRIQNSLRIRRRAVERYPRIAAIVSLEIRHSFSAIRMTVAGIANSRFRLRGALLGDCSLLVRQFSRQSEIDRQPFQRPNTSRNVFKRPYY